MYSRPCVLIVLSYDSMAHWRVASAVRSFEGRVPSPKHRVATLAYLRFCHEPQRRTNLAARVVPIGLNTQQCSRIRRPRHTVRTPRDTNRITLRFALA